MSPSRTRSARHRTHRPPLLAALLVGLLLLLAACSDYGYLPYGSRFLPYELLDSIQSAVAFMRIVFALSGLALLVAGWKIYRFAVALPGAVLGAAIGLGLGLAGDENWLLGILGLLLGGVVGAWLAMALHDLVVFLIGGAIGALLFGGLYTAFAEAFPPALLLIVGGLVGGVLLLALSHLWIVALSSAVGALLLGVGVNAPVGWMFLFFLGGIAVQYGLASALGEKLPMPGKASGGTEKAVVASVADPPVNPPLPPVRPRPTPEPRPMVGAAPPSAMLVSAEGEIYRVTDGFRIGRGSACDLRLADRSVSRNHAVIRHANGRWFLQDQGSLHGTFVNGARTDAVVLNPGDKISIGDSKFDFKPV